MCNVVGRAVVGMLVCFPLSFFHLFGIDGYLFSPFFLVFFFFFRACFSCGFALCNFATSFGFALLRPALPSVESKTAGYTRTMHGSTHELYLTSRVGVALRDGGGG